MKEEAEAYALKVKAEAQAFATRLSEERAAAARIAQPPAIIESQPSPVKASPIKETA